MRQSSVTNAVRWRVVWLVSFAGWIALAFCYAILRYRWMVDTGMTAQFWNVLSIPLLTYLIAALCTPGVYWMAHYYPIEQSNWKTRVPLHIAGSLVFTILHVGLRMSTLWLKPIKDDYGHVMPPSLRFAWQLFLVFTYDDALTTYWPIVILVQMLDFHRRTRQKELQASQLEAELAKARLQNLKAQLRPHFLFNALNSISALMHVNVKAADTMISQLGNLLRLSLESGDSQESSFREELEFVQGYLQIEQTRFSDRLSVEFDIDPQTYDAAVPHMLLQPLVENAVRHGIAQRSHDGHITIRAQHTRDDLVISVKDNGCGFDLGSACRSANGVGLSNTSERLRKLYGDRHVFSASRVPTGGVQVSISIPFAQMNDATAGRSRISSAKLAQCEGSSNGNSNGSR